jgi:hypothetical protein
MINPVSPIIATSNHRKPRGYNSYQNSDFKITTLPPELTLNKPKNKTWTELLSPWLIVGGFLLVYGLLNGWIGD